ncbi:DUF2726 domain-containing protein [Catenovulum sediminis]|uniref:DUF2726 domain-containing protein n=1 Tax=Catenovulum sediminis TaxID=1740262 RepID=A0ABV1RKS5_9ALTE
MKILLVFIIFVAFLGVVKWRQNQQERSKTSRFENIEKINKLELNFKQDLNIKLNQVLGEQYHIHRDVNLTRLLNFEDAQFAKIAKNKVIDFVITDLSGIVCCVLKVDDSRQNESKSNQQDWLRLCLQGRHNLLRVKSSHNVSMQDLASLLSNMGLQNAD